MIYKLIESAEQAIRAYKSEPWMLDLYMHLMEEVCVEAKKSPGMTVICGVCFTSSWQPCEAETPNAIPDPVTKGWMVCGMCVHHEYTEMVVRLLVDNIDPLDLRTPADEELYQRLHKKRYPQNY